RDDGGAAEAAAAETPVAASAMTSARQDRRMRAILSRSGRPSLPAAGACPELEAALRRAAVSGLIVHRRNGADAHMPESGDEPAVGLRELDPDLHGPARPDAEASRPEPDPPCDRAAGAFEP